MSNCNLRTQFRRTVCDCEQCSEACVHCPGMLIPGDDLAIARHIGVSLDVLYADLLLASPGALVMRSSGMLCRIPSIVPAIMDGGCVFLKDGRCLIHPVAPFGCSHFDSHMGWAEGDRRSKAALRCIASSQGYIDRWFVLLRADRRSESPEVKRGRMQTHA